MLDEILHRVRDQHARLPIVPQSLECVRALLLEPAIADGEDLVEEQDVRVDVRHHRKAEPGAHAGGVVAQLQVLEVAQLGELDDRPVALRASAGWRPIITAFIITLS